MVPETDHRVPAAPGPAGLGATVAAEMEAIFGPAAAAPRRPTAAAAPTAIQRSGARAWARAPGRKRDIGAILAAAFVGLGVGYLLGTPSLQVAQAPAAAVPELVPPAVDAAPPLLESPRLALPSGPAAIALAASMDEAPRPAPASKPARPPATRQARAAPARAASACSGGSARCLHQRMLAADQRLRRTYRQAIRSGVSRSVLLSYRSEWNRVLRRHADDPMRLVARYDALSADLSHRTRSERRR